MKNGIDVQNLLKDYNNRRFRTDEEYLRKRALTVEDDDKNEKIRKGDGEMKAEEVRDQPPSSSRKRHRLKYKSIFQKEFKDEFIRHKDIQG